jgi:hypothetical protein
MNVEILISILQTKDPKAAVVLRDYDGATGLVELRGIDDVELRGYDRKGSSFLAFWDADLPYDEKGTDVCNFIIKGVLLE